MKLAIYHNLPSGGAKRALHEMTRRLAQRHEVDVYTLSCAEHNFCDLRPLVRRHVVFPFRPLPLARRPFGRLNQGIRTADLLRLKAVQRRIAAEIDAQDYDVVLVHNCQFSQSPGLLKYLRTPSVYYCQEPPRLIHEPPVERPYNRFSRLQRLGNLVDPLPSLYRSTLRRLDRANTLSATTILVNSYYSRETLYRVYGIFAHVVYLGVDTDKFRPLALPRENILLSVGALTSRKGFDFLVLSLAQLQQTHKPRLVIVCNGVIEREQAYLASLADNLAVEISFRTLVTDDELVTLYNQAQLTVYAPIMEPFGFVPLESMACGTPVVGVSEAGIRESVISGSTGILTDRDPIMFASAIQSLLADPEQLRAFEQRCRHHVLINWNWANSVSNLERHLAQTAHSIG